MSLKKNLAKVGVIILIFQILSPALIGQLKEVCNFKGVELPFRLKHEDAVLKKDKYDLEAMILQSPSLTKYYLRIKKGSKVLAQIEGDQWIYESEGMYMMRDPNIPDKPTMKLRRNSKDKLIIFIIETGKKNSMSPFLRMRFKMDYVE